MGGGEGSSASSSDPSETCNLLPHQGYEFYWVRHLHWQQKQAEGKAQSHQEGTEQKILKVNELVLMDTDLNFG